MINEQDQNPYLVENKCLTNGSPVSMPGGREEVECQDQGQAQQDGHCSEQRGDEKHHDRGADESYQAGVPREIFKGWPDIKIIF